MTALPPWVLGPLELLAHAEGHYLQGDDLDRRLAMIGFDNAIELSVTTYLTLDPVQRGGVSYPTVDVENWLKNFHSKVDFFLQQIVANRGLTVECDKATFVWHHDVRNGQYHSGGPTVPERRALEGVRKAAIWVFATLFGVTDPEAELGSEVARQLQNDLPKKTPEHDRAIDGKHGTVTVADDGFYVSEIVHALDPVWYAELAAEVLAQRPQLQAAPQVAQAPVPSPAAQQVAAPQPPPPAATPASPASAGPQQAPAANQGHGNP